MAQKIYIFKYFFLIILSFSSFAYSETITGNAIVVDGDSLKIGNKNIRLHGIDSPEFNQTCIMNELEWDCGKRATLFLFELINLKKIKCNAITKDQYDRWIAICYLKNLDINQYIVEKGWAIAYRYYSLDYVNAEESAKKNKKGIWKGTFIEPYLFRKKLKN